MSEGMMAFAERKAPEHTQLIDERCAWLSHGFPEAVAIEQPESTGGLMYTIDAGRGYANIVPALGGRGGQDWVSLGRGHTRVILRRRQPDHLVTLIAPVEQDFTFSPSAPMFEGPVGTGDMISEIRNSVRDLWRHYVASAGLATLDAPILDIPSALRQARSQAGLPVQDLAAMFGIKRRQFYNLTSGEQQPEQERESRIAQVTDAINKLSEWVGGNSRTVRALLLARFDGDSIYDAAVADQDDRLGWALERAYSAAAQNTSLPRRLPSSHRPTPAEAAAVREYLRSTHDDTSAESDE